VFPLATGMALVWRDARPRRISCTRVDRLAGIRSASFMQGVVPDHQGLFCSFHCEGRVRGGCMLSQNCGASQVMSMLTLRRRRPEAKACDRPAALPFAGHELLVAYVS
jgi:hypothetical protein